MLAFIPASSVHPHLYEEYCTYRGHRLWGAYFCSSLSVFVGGLVILLIWKFGSRALRGLRVMPKHNRTHPQGVNPDAVLSLRNSLRTWAFSIISAQRRPGKILTLFTFCVHLCSVVTYMIMTAYPVEYCMQDYSTVFMVDVVFNLFYVVNFGLRFIAAQDELLVWVELKSLIDFFTITPSIISLFTRRAWLGLKFLRALHLLELPRVLQLLNILHSNTSLKLTRLISVLVGSLLTAAGVVHLVENSGDPWSSVPNTNLLTYFNSVYFLVVTMSTVGYGDVWLHTVSGRFFTIIFITTGLGLFASYVPEVIGIIINRKRFDGSYTNTSEETHVVVCGHITLASASAFMKEFLHKDRGDVHIKVLFLGNFHPDQELVAFFNLHFVQASFYEGSVLERHDQERVMMSEASACLILCDRFADDQNNEDVANLMRVISIKRYCPDTRVIVQMFKHSSKAYLQNVPNWDWSRGDAVICLAELKLGFMAQSCQVPGLSTLLANLFTMQSEVENEGNRWQNLYREGIFNEMYTEYLSSSFSGLSFAQASKLCFLKLKLLLIGIEYQNGDDDLSVLVNPPSSIKIKNRTLGFFIASNAAHAKRASLYCLRCHSDIKDPTKMRPCTCNNCKDVPSRNFSTVNLGCRRPSLGVLSCSRSDQLCELGLTEKQLQQCVGRMEREEVKLDSTGLFHWCTPVPLQDVTLVRLSYFVFILFRTKLS
ncbi:calcium-activated potassium channel subunit alpha-1-like [Colossoma macropomum]|uniref:calcium-activated potassium channel subunit alpha-1-like n=1 Tax=Colossoma macropomum TaxID=42526 RepID=UPI001863D78B|nr:calcium-activated potassium channel subunit alpha-1-like [Colossoma macropomum]